MVKMFEFRDLEKPQYGLFLEKNWPYSVLMNKKLSLEMSERYQAQAWCKSKLGNQANRESVGQIFYNTKRLWVNQHMFFLFKKENDAFEFKMSWG